VAGVPHATAQDDTYRGYFIPKGTVVLSSQWALLHDPINYPEPEQFVPERYLKQSPSGTWTYRSDVRDPRDFCFGWGRRICPGAHVAEQSLFATITTVLHTLNVKRAKDVYGVEIVPEAEVSAGLTSHPKAFDYDITMRKDAEDLVQLCVAN
jgi:cytochrome P450